MLKITVLGTGTSQGIPVIGCECNVCSSYDPHDKRLRAAVMITNENTQVVIDAGPDFRQQMLTARVKNLDGLVITHNHKDHTGGIDDVRAFNWIQKKPMDIFAEEPVLNTIRNDFSYAFEADRYPGVPDINLHPLTTLQPFTINTLELIPIRAHHHRMPVLGFRAGDFSYLTDANTIAPEELNKMRGSRVVIINALRKEKHISHFTLQEAVNILKDLSPEQGYITHISHQMGLHHQVQQELPDGISLAWDGLEFRV
jgi:phosphoribosyl 1,2-cyclic phosphate phosphodiesterase